MKLIVCGGRRYRDQAKLEFVLWGIHDTYGFTEIVEGGCRFKDPLTGEDIGADYYANQFANLHGFACKTFDADWPNLGKSAGPIRNAKMADYGTGCIAFPGGKGTDDMFEKAVKRQMQTWDFRMKGRL